MLTVLIDGQKQYGKEYSLKATLDYFRLKLEKKYTVAQVLFALDKYTDKKNDIPSPADINTILDPEKPKITTAQYIAARDNQRRNQYPMYSSDSQIISDYETQEATAQEDFKIQNEEIAQIVGNSVKRIAG